MSQAGTSQNPAAETEDEAGGADATELLAPHDEGLSSLRDGISSSNAWSSTYDSSDGGDPSWSVVGFSE